MIADAAVRKHLSKGEDGPDYRFDQRRHPTPLMFLKDGSHNLRHARFWQLLKFRSESGSRNHHLWVGAEQSLHFKQVFATAGWSGWLTKKWSLSTRPHDLSGSRRQEILDTRGKNNQMEKFGRSVTRAKKLGNTWEVAKEVGIGAIKYFDLMHSVQSNVIFEWTR